MISTDETKLKDTVVSTLDLGDLPEAEQTEIISQLERNIIRKINLLILDRLTEAEREELETKESDEEAEAYLKEKIFDLENVKVEAAVWVINDWRARQHSSS